MKFFKYLWYIIKHKFWVTLYCFSEGIIWRGILHDLSKFYPSEFFPYMNWFYGKFGKSCDKGWERHNKCMLKYDYAWLFHQKRNKHHWQYWLLQLDDGDIKALPMPEKYITEMICDWRGASRAQGKGDNTPEWYEKNRHRQNLHSETKYKVETKLIGIYGLEKMRPHLSVKKE